jgi:UDP-2,3-diacylglucosamine pyrophosphatase LpxH
MPTPHEEIVAALLTALEPLNGQVRLLGRLCDPLINNGSDKETYLFIPDLHLLTPDRQAQYKYGFNYSETDPRFQAAELLARLLKSLYALQSTWAQQGDNELVTVQLGDFFDLWREFSGEISESRIQNSHAEILDLLYRGPFAGKPECLDAVMLLGNHDTRNGKFLNGIQFSLNYMNEAADQKPFLFANHGDAFDLVEHLPEPIKETAVNYFSRMKAEGDYDVGVWSGWAATYNSTCDFKDAITQPDHDLLINSAVTMGVSGTALPDRLCEEIDSVGAAAEHFFGKYYAAIDQAAEENLIGQHVRVVVMGHTHMAKMIVYKPAEGRPMLLMDVGAWIERCQYPLAEGGAVIKAPSEPSAQLGVINGNDARIYQIHLPPGS